MTALPDRAQGIRTKILRAKRHIREFERVRRTFRQRGGHSVRVQREGQSDLYRLYADIRRQSPARLGAIAGDAVHNLRSALDLLVWQLVEANSREPGRNTSFPITEKPGTYKPPAEGHLEGVSDDAVWLINDLCHRQSGALWRIHDIDIEDKHHVLIPVWGRASDPVVELLPGFRLPISRPGESIFPVEDGTDLGGFVATLGILAHRMGAELHVDADAIFEEAFGGPSSVKGEPVLKTLIDLEEMVRTEIRRFDPLLRA